MYVCNVCNACNVCNVCNVCSVCNVCNVCNVRMQLFPCRWVNLVAPGNTYSSGSKLRRGPQFSNICFIIVVT